MDLGDFAPLGDLPALGFAALGDFRVEFLFLATSPISSKNLKKSSSEIAVPLKLIERFNCSYGFASHPKSLRDFGFRDEDRLRV